ncbi:Hypothetical predicted protein [Paramuricea clavata]|uniref:Uncharacterized protein n=1 Tax=Paramuricea clavata TaxID=317549 RepID=A0A6S7H948_PARCT|nr:Hypothetical predicted protein [Paramuricea clavata]
MTGVKLAKAFGFLLMVVIACSKQIPEEQHSTYPVTNEVHFTTNPHEYHDEDLEVNVGKRVVGVNNQPNPYKGGGTTDNRQVWFHLNPDAQIADRNQLSQGQRIDLHNFIGSIKIDKIFAENAGQLDSSSKKYFRLDMQGMVKKNNQYHHNLQVQLNGVKRSKKVPSTTYAIVLVPQNANGLLTDRVVRRAFQDSSNRDAAVTLEIRNK